MNAFVTSLDAYSAQLAKLLGTTEATLYARKRQMMRDGLIPFVPGKGPGNGVPFTPETVAILAVGHVLRQPLDQLPAVLDAIRQYVKETNP